MKLGRVQSKHDSRTLQLADYVNVVSLPVPPTKELLEITSSWPMLANNQFNCCTSAAAGHMVHHWTAANQRGVFLTDADVIRAHAHLTGDRLMDCVSMLDALKYWRNTGIGNHRVHSFVNARAQNEGQLRGIVHLFGSAYIGLDLPKFVLVGDPTGWTGIPWTVPASVSAEDAAPQPANGHCVTAIGYGEDGVYVVTWGALKTMSWEFYNRYSIELYAVLSSDWVCGDQVSPSGFDLTSLQRDLSLVQRTAPG
ncbi:MAG: hypothetical protein ACYCOR_15955 [Acidobacteriaceae bacterium]